MVQLDGQTEQRARLGRMLWSHRRRILASTAALGLAAFLAGTLVPPIHRVTIRIAVDPNASARWTEPALRGLADSVPSRPEGARPGILATWFDLFDHASILAPDVGAERLPDGALVAWAESGDAAQARRHAELVADELMGGVEGVAEPARVEDTAAISVSSLEASLERAREALAATQARLDEANASVSTPSGGDAERRTRLDADRHASHEARRELRGLERFARNLPDASASDAPSPVQGSKEWADWRDAVARRDRVAAQVVELSRTLLDGHPRMTIVRLRLSDLEAELGAARERLANVLDRRIVEVREDIARLDRAVLDAEMRLGVDAAVSDRIREAETARNAAQMTLDALEDTLRVAERALQDRPAAPVIERLPPVPSREVSETERRPNVWPIVAASAVFGFLASTLYTIVGAFRQSSSPGAATMPMEIPVRGRRRAAKRPTDFAAPERRAAGPTFDVTSADELVGGILASDISRIVLVPLSAEDRPAGVEIVRRLALRGRQGALVDLSEGQLAARAMGVAPDALGVSDMIAGEATFAEIARRDFATQAEVFGLGRTTVGEAAFLAMERRNVLEFIERNYEVTLVACADLSLETVKALMTADAALVVTVDPRNGEAIGDGVNRLRDAGLADMILADGLQLTPEGFSPSARAASS